MLSVDAKTRHADVDGLAEGGVGDAGGPAAGRGVGGTVEPGEVIVVDGDDVAAATTRSEDYA